MAISSRKFLQVVSGVFTEAVAIITSAGSGDADKIPALDSSGRLDVSFMPTGIGADTAVIAASENLAANDFVNVWNSTGAKVRKADATAVGKEAHGFVLAAVTSGNNATVYFEGTNSGLSGLTPGVQFLQTTAGTAAATPPSGSGNVVQQVGVAISTSAINVEFKQPVTLS